MPTHPRPLEPPDLGAVPGEVIVRVSSGWTIEEVNATFGTRTIAGLPQAWTYLVMAPDGAEPARVAASMEASGLCDHAQLNYLLESPEAEQRSLAFYEGGFNHGDYVDQYALERIGAAKAHATSTGSGILVAVIDTGADLDHMDLADNLALPGYDFIDDDLEPADLPNDIDDDGNGLIDEATGHGSHVAGIIAAAAPQVMLLPLRVLDSDGTGTVFNVARAIYHAIDAGAQVINLSLGLDETVDSIRDAIQEARDADILVVASAGNRGVRDQDHFPANLSEVMAVAATNSADQKAYFSSYGSHISMSAPGEGIMSTYWNGGYALWSGTSMAAPFIAAAGALRLAMELAEPGELQQLIEDTSLDLDATPHPYMNEIGEGRVDLLALVQAPGDNSGPGGSKKGGRGLDQPTAARIASK